MTRLALGGATATVPLVPSGSAEGVNTSTWGTVAPLSGTLTSRPDMMTTRPSGRVTRVGYQRPETISL